jgi:hypothetical protein
MTISVRLIPRQGSAKALSPRPRFEAGEGGRRSEAEAAG